MTSTGADSLLLSTLLAASLPASPLPLPLPLSLSLPLPPALPIDPDPNDVDVPSSARHAITKHAIAISSPRRDRIRLRQSPRRLGPLPSTTLTLELPRDRDRQMIVATLADHLHAERQSFAREPHRHHRRRKLEHVEEPGAHEVERREKRCVVPRRGPAVRRMQHHAVAPEHRLELGLQRL